MNSGNTIKMVKMKLLSCATVIALFTFVPNKANLCMAKVKIQTGIKLRHFGLYVTKAKLFLSTTGLERPYGKTFISVTEVSVAKTEISLTGPARHFI